MDSRVEQGMIGPGDLKTIRVSEEEIEQKLESICASAFRMLKTQLDEKREALISVTTAAELIESSSNYYSTKVLQKKLSENCRLALNQPSLDYPLKHIENERKQEYDSILSDINNNYDVIRESIKANIITIKKSANSIEDKKPPLKKQLNTFKSDLINALQNAAEECCELLVPKGKVWTNQKLEEFTDIFGCVVRVFGSSVHLDKSVGYGLNFGKKLRIDGKLPKTLSSLASIKEMKLDDIEQMINQLINECYNYKDSYYLLQKIKENLEKLSTNEMYRGYIQFKIEGTFSHYLKSVSFLKKEKNIVDEPLALIKKQHAEIEMKGDGAVAQQIQEILKPLQASVETYRANTDKVISFINAEARNAAEYLNGASLECYNDLASSISSMQFTNSEAKTVSIATDTATHKVQLAYESAIKYAKVMDQKEFDIQAKWADESLSVAHVKMLDLNPQLLALESHRVANAKKLAIAKEMYNGSIYRASLGAYKREASRLAELKARYVYVLKDYNHVNLLPKAIAVYGEFHFDGANAKSKINDAFQHLEVIPPVLKTLKDTFNILLDEIKANKECKLGHYQQKVELEIEKAGDALKVSAENIVLAIEYKNRAAVKLTKAQEEFPPNIHAEHQESFDILEMRSSEVKKEYASQEKNLAFMRLLPDAMKDYSSIMLNSIKMQKESIFVTQSCNQLSVNVDNIRRAKLEAESLAREGVVKLSLEILAQDKLKEMANVLDIAQKALKDAEQIKLREEKALIEAKEKYPEQLHSKPQEFFDVASNDYALALTNYNAAVKKHMDACEDAKFLHNRLISAKQVQHEKQLATELRQFLLKTIMMNFSLWKPSSRWGGGVAYQYVDPDSNIRHNYRIPHGIDEMIRVLTNSTDHHQWMDTMVSVSAARELLASKWKYHIFHVRNEKTGQLYKILKDHLKLDNIQALQKELSKIPGIKIPAIDIELEEKRQGLISSV